uniref:Uncharacterized protein n=1 Tax=Pipistrellus kuhlii TaxID=59472 RepID=A0A7J7RMW3_PIPKU|nr:hypothetical protein mPipKuh1_010393 [Pipistrellus kuhlii]
MQLHGVTASEGIGGHSHSRALWWVTGPSVSQRGPQASSEAKGHRGAGARSLEPPTHIPTLPPESWHLGKHRGLLSFPDCTSKFTFVWGIHVHPKMPLGQVVLEHPLHSAGSLQEALEGLPGGLWPRNPCGGRGGSPPAGEDSRRKARQ